MPVVVGENHSLFLDLEEGEVSACGSNNFGQLGQGDTTNYSLPRGIGQLPKISAIAAGSNHSLCLSTEGDVYSFGNNGAGQLGLEGVSSQTTPVLVPGLPPIRFIACGSCFSAAICENNSLWMWGDNRNGQLGFENPKAICFGPRRIRNLNVSTVSCGANHTMVRTTNGSLFAFGQNQTGQLGLKHLQTPVCEPTRVECATPWRQVICGGNFTLLLDDSGSIWSTGDNQFGQLGLHDNQARSEFTKIPDINARHVVCGTSHALCITNQDKMYGWGDKQRGQAGEDNLVPQELLTEVETVASGYSHTFVLFKQKSVHVTGRNASGQLGVSDCTDRTAFENAGSTIAAKWFTCRDIPPRTPWSKFDYLDVLSADDRSLLRAIDDSIHRSRLQGDGPTWCIHPPQRTTSSWNQLTQYLMTKRQDYRRTRTAWKKEQTERVATISQTQGAIVELEESLRQRKQELRLLQLAERKMVNQGTDERELASLLDTMFTQCEQFSEKEGTLNNRLCKRLAQKPLSEWEAEEMEIILWRMNLLHHRHLFLEHQIDGQALLALDYAGWIDLGLSGLEACAILYHRELMCRPGYASFLREGETECLVCSHHTQQDTQKLLDEHKIPLQRDWIQRGWTMPYLIYAVIRREDLSVPAREYPQAIRKIKILRDAHTTHLAEQAEMDDSQELFWKEEEPMDEAEEEVDPFLEKEEEEEEMGLEEEEDFLFEEEDGGMEGELDAGDAEADFDDF